PQCVLSCFSLLVTAPTETSTLSLHDALPILLRRQFDREGVARHSAQEQVRLLDQQAAAVPGLAVCVDAATMGHAGQGLDSGLQQDRKSTRLNSSHVKISYAVFCLKKKNKKDR